MAPDPLTPWIERWRLEPDGEPFDSLNGRLAPVRFEGRAAMLKVGRSADEARGGRLLEWWNGQGAAPLLAREADAVLVARAEGSDLAALARSGRDDEASAIICDVVGALHRPRDLPPPEGLPPLRSLFAKLLGAGHADPRLAQAARTAGELLAEPRDVVVLHGDMHHENILDFGEVGWLAIDPWGVIGERAYDYANIVRNPDLELVCAPGRIERRLELLSAGAGLDRERLRRWSFAHAGLAAVWEIEDKMNPERSFAVLDRLAG
ncbi:aminoglycoside phosphotransferase family protein [Phenylobacterium sp.]|uniref:aminoglycoside phosphotransferase family protein n=1 Tax=Phenylobacterium sp. TaxID=1871053 RepID=UPI0035B1A9AA